MPTAIIAGTGINQLPGVTLKPETVQTAYGLAHVYRVDKEGEALYFLARHGAQHSVPPHKINYRANMKALSQLGVKRVLATYAVGSIHPDIPPQAVVVVDDFLDFTSGRPLSFFDGGQSGVKHVDMSQPYCPVLRRVLLEQAAVAGLAPRASGTYVAANGPRFESPAEIRMFRQLGGDVVGMTGVPEVTLARELGMCLAAAAISINWAVGVQPELQIVGQGLPALRIRLMQLFMETLAVTRDEDCLPAALY